MVDALERVSSRPVAGQRADLSWSGRFVVIRQQRGVLCVDAIGAEPRGQLLAAAVDDVACVGGSAWLVHEGSLRRFDLTTRNELGQPVALPGGAGRLVPMRGETANAAIWESSERSLLRVVDGELRVEPLPPELVGAAAVFPFGGSRVLVSERQQILITEVGRAPTVVVRLPEGGVVRSAASILGGRAIACLLERAGECVVLVLRGDGGLVHRLTLPGWHCGAIASRRAVAVVCTDGQALHAVDLRFGRSLHDTVLPRPITGLNIDENGKFIMAAGVYEGGEPPVFHMGYTEVFGGQRGLQARATEVAEPTDEPAPVDAGVASEPVASAEAAEPEPPAPPQPIPEVHLHALAPLPRPPPPRPSSGAKPYRSPSEHLHDLADLVAARTLEAIAEAWDSGRLSLPTEDSRPFEHEVLALTGGRMGAAAEQLELAARRARETSERLAQRQNATLAAGTQLPYLELIREYGLSPMAARVLIMVAGPNLRGEVARLYGILANDLARPLCDRHLIEVILGGSDPEARTQVVTELADGSALLRYGLVRMATSADEHALFSSLSVDPVVLTRLRGEPESGIGPSEVIELRSARPEALLDLAMPHQLKVDLVTALATPPRDGGMRVVLRGRQGSGRRTLAACLAARASRGLAVINVERMPRQAARMASVLRLELLRARMRHAVPCVSGVEWLPADDREGLEIVRSVLRAHPGPIILRTTPEHRLPLDPGYLDFSLPSLNETDSLAYWQRALDRRGLIAQRASELAARYRIGPGTIETIINTVVHRRALDRPAEPRDASDELDHAARQHVEARLGNVATHIKRLASWETVALPDDVIDSIREFLGRVGHRRKVYEEWGYDARMTSSRGLTALFHGPPGTGKSMVAGLIARELGLDLYRVDLAQITSKWIGETEKNLAEVFDAAEDGQVVILFDEADSLFAKRTEVKSSVDRYANLEVNYLLQRLDTFEGIAILTTNLEGSLDDAFKRRLSLRLAFPFPDEEMRVRLWMGHIPPEAPTAGDFDFEALARKYPLSGGYIRNSALRAAFLAAQEKQSLSQAHIERAIQLEYREMGKLAPGGRME